MWHPHTTLPQLEISYAVHGVKCKQKSRFLKTWKLFSRSIILTDILFLSGPSLVLYWQSEWLNAVGPQPQPTGISITKVDVAFTIRLNFYPSFHTIILWYAPTEYKWFILVSLNKLKRKTNISHIIFIFFCSF